MSRSSERQAPGRQQTLQVLDEPTGSAAAALRELPEALILVFDSELRFVLSAGQALGPSGRTPSSFHEGQSIADAFPGGAVAADRAAVPLRPGGRDSLA